MTDQTQADALRALTPEQQSQIRDCTARIVRARAGGGEDRITRAGLMAEGWAAGAVLGAFEALERAAQEQVGVPVHMVPPTDDIALTGQNTGADNG